MSNKESMPMTLVTLLILLLQIPLPAAAEGRYKVVKVEAERLPDLNIPRSGHAILNVGGEMTVIGGHTTNFVPTPTAEYFKDGAWHVLPMAYNHDNGFAAVLPSGEVIIGGGHQEELGVGQTYTLERYDLKSRTFKGFGSLDRRRVLANATTLADGRVIISGNHYAPDAIECYDGQSQVQPVKEVAQGRSNPYILPISNGDVLILGGNDVYDRHPDTIWVDLLKGNAFRAPLLEQWRPVYTDQPFDSRCCSTDEDTYLLTAKDKSGQLAIVEVRDTTFALLPTVCPIPMRCQFGPILYKGPIVIDRPRRRGYIIGVDSLCHRQFVLAVDYAVHPAPLTLYYTDSLEHSAVTIPTINSDGDLILTGGSPDDNYNPLTTVWCYHFATPMPTAATAGIPFWLWVVMATAAAGIIAYIIFILWHRKKPTADIAPISEDDSEWSKADDKTADLMERISRLMDEERIYLRSDLKLQDVAVRLRSNSSYVSECINNVHGQTFSQFVNAYRVRHAQELMRQQPDMKTVTIATASGFSTEVSFFRNFKAVVGMTPREWIASL